MIGWTRRVLAAAWVISASFACAGTTPEPSTPQYLRSPPLDYGDAPRSAGDGEVMGADRRSTQEWLAGGVTTAHPAPGWSLRGGVAHFTLEHAPTGAQRAGEATVCPPGSGPPAPDDVQARAALRRAWLAAARQPARPEFAAVADLPEEPSDFLTCDSR